MTIVRIITTIIVGAELVEVTVKKPKTVEKAVIGPKNIIGTGDSIIIGTIDTLIMVVIIDLAVFMEAVIAGKPSIVSTHHES